MGKLYLRSGTFLLSREAFISLAKRAGVDEATSSAEFDRVSFLVECKAYTETHGLGYLCGLIGIDPTTIPEPKDVSNQR